jgi:galactokinase
MARFVQYTAIGGPEVLELAEGPVPTPGEGQVVVEVKAVGVNPIDVKLRAGKRPSAPITQPRVSGSDAAGLIAEIGPDVGFEGTITTTLPIGAGLSSSASLEVAVALALGFDGTLLDLARAAQRAEHAAVGVPCGVMDQIASVFGREGHALLIDCRNLEVLPVPFPEGADLVVLNPGESRQLAGSAYGERRAACETAETQIGPLRDASQDDLAKVRDPVVRKRARHVISENERVMTVAKALRRADWATIGEAMFASHRSLRDDFEVSTPALDALVDNLAQTPGVYGARLTGAGFGGCVVAITEPGALPFTTPVRPSRGARIA